MTRRAPLGVVRWTAAALVVLLALAPPARPTAADAGSDLAEIRRQVSRVRGLEPTSDVPLEVVEQEALRRALAGDFARDRRSREATISQRFLVVLGLVPPEFDSRAFALALVAEQAPGVYRRSERKMYLTTAAGLDPMGKLAVAHELAHALQDQHFDLRRLLPDDASADRNAAVLGLIEGDATLTMLHWGRQFLRPEEKSGLGNRPRSPAAAGLEQAPLVVREEIMFPYRDGLDLVRTLHQDGGFEAVNRAFGDPPVSTEQVIHPQKYLAREAPRLVSTPPLAEALGESWRLLKTDVLGEIGLRVLVQQFSDESTAREAAAGWGGDSYTIVEGDGGRLVVVLNTAWDSEPDAAEFFNAFVPTVERRFGTTQTRVINRPSLGRWSVPGGAIQALKTNDRVILIYAPDAETLETVATQLS